MKLNDILFFRHYNSNRAPLSLSFDAAWLQINKGFTKVLAEWIRDKLASQSDVYFVTELQVTSNVMSSAMAEELGYLAINPDFLETKNRSAMKSWRNYTKISAD